MPRRNDGFHHVTVTTGHLYWSPRSALQDKTLEFVRPHLDALLAKSKDAVVAPGPGTFTTTIARPTNGVLLATVSIDRAWGKENIPLVTFAVVPNPAHVPDIWAMMAESDPNVLREPVNVSDAATCLAQPWASAFAAPQALRWLGDYERCLTWAWLLRFPLAM